MKNKIEKFCPKDWEPEEFEVFLYWASGYPKAVIAKLTGIEVHTVDLKIRCIYLNLNVNSRHEMVQQAWLERIATHEVFEGIVRYKKR